MDKGLVQIIVNSQNTPKETVVAFMAANGVACSVYGGGRVKGADFSGIPHVFIFDAKGENVYEGSWGGIESNVSDACKAAPDWLIGPKDWSKVKAEADKLRQRKGMGQAAADLRKKEQADGEDKADAGELLDRVEKHVEREMKRADSLVESGDPLKALEIWSRIAKEFKGDELGARADEISKEKNKDAAFKKEIEAAKQYAKIEALASSIKPPRDTEATSKWRQKNAGPIGQLLAMYKSLEKKHPETRVFARAKAKISSMSLE